MIDPKLLNGSQSPYLWTEVFIFMVLSEVVFWLIIIWKFSLAILMLYTLNLENNFKYQAIEE